MLTVSTVALIASPASLAAPPTAARAVTFPTPEAFCRSLTLDPNALIDDWVFVADSLRACASGPLAASAGTASTVATSDAAEVLITSNCFVRLAPMSLPPDATALPMSVTDVLTAPIWVQT